MRISTIGLMASGVVFGVQGDPFEAIQRQTVTPSYFKTQWSLTPVILGQSTNFTYQIPADASSSFASGVEVQLPLILCQTSATGADPVTSNNTWTVTQFENPCINAEKDSTNRSECIFKPATEVILPVNLYQGGQSSSMGYSNFFFCFAAAIKLNDLMCETYSPYFGIQGVPNMADQGMAKPSPGTPDQGFGGLVKKQQTATTSAPSPTATLAVNSIIQNTLHITLNTPVVGTSPVTATSSGSPVVTASTVTKSIPETILTPTTAPSLEAASHSSSKGGLSLGAKIGIGLGALGFVLILLLLALFCLRRRHAKRSISRSEQVMLTQSVHNESRDLVIEKEIATGATLHDPDHDNDTDSGPPVLPLPTTRHSALSPYETLPSQPYSGSAAAIPRRKPGSAPTSAGSDTLTRAVSTTHSERTISIPPSATRASNEHHFEEYHDVPMYSTARAFQGSFLESEDGRSSSAANTSSEEEARRLEEARLEEEEERRIDAAIAEAERKRGTLR